MANVPLAKPLNNILIVDDTPENLRLLSKMLESQGYRVRRSISGRMALQAAQIEPPSLILLDINMPDMNGYDVCRQLKIHPRTSDVPVIFISALDQTTNKIQAFDLGAVDYITKPFQEQEVLARVRAQLTIQRQQQLLIEHNQQLERSQLETQLLLSTIQAANQSNDIDSALQAILKEVCSSIHWDYGEAWMLSHSAERESPCSLEVASLSEQEGLNHDSLRLHLRQAYAHGAEHRKVRDLQIFHQAAMYQEGEDLVGQVWQHQTPQWRHGGVEQFLIRDTVHRSSQDAVGFPVRHAARSPDETDLAADPLSEHQLETVMAVPVVFQEQCLAVLLFYSLKHLTYDQRVLNLVSTVALQLGAFIQRQQAEDALRQANLELQRLVSLDGLTQLANRRRFDEYLAQEWRRSRREQQPLSLILCDVDHFKPYNDHYGHQAGDDCLKRIAHAIVATIKRPADLAARYGGEEFALILPGSDLLGAVHIAEQLQRAIADLQIPHAYSGASPMVTLSLGIACLVPSMQETPAMLIECADRALYAAKASGRNAYDICDTCPTLPIAHHEYDHYVPQPVLEHRPEASSEHSEADLSGHSVYEVTFGENEDNITPANR